jgi:YHS domain-containing protein
MLFFPLTNAEKATRLAGYPEKILVDGVIYYFCRCNSKLEFLRPRS